MGKIKEILMEIMYDHPDEEDMWQDYFYEYVRKKQRVKKFKLLKTDKHGKEKTN